MCRHLGYLGSPRAPAELIFGAPHSLLRQSYAPADMRGGGTVNADGFGLGWYDETGEPVRYRRPTPMWADETLPPLAASVKSGAFIAAARNGTPGMPVSEGACAPFVDGHWLFSHNGVVLGWPESVVALAGKLPVTELLTLEAPTDSALLWALLRDRLRAGEDPLAAVTDLVAAVERAAPGSRLNLLLTDGEVMIATAWTHSLSVLAVDGSVVIASEPYDSEPGWVPVPERHAVRVEHGQYEFFEIQQSLEIQYGNEDRSATAS